jgi:hypothetical protein
MVDFVQINRDPFARASLVRRQHSRPKYGCDWCGQWNGYGKLFEYGTEADGLYNRAVWHKGWFCSLPCHDTYHGYDR